MAGNIHETLDAILAAKAEFAEVAEEAINEFFTPNQEAAKGMMLSWMDPAMRAALQQSVPGAMKNVEKKLNKNQPKKRGEQWPTSLPTPDLSQSMIPQ